MTNDRLNSKYLIANDKNTPVEVSRQYQLHENILHINKHLQKKLTLINY